MEGVSGRLPLRAAQPSRYDIGAAPMAIVQTAVTSVVFLVKLIFGGIVTVFVIGFVTGLFFPEHPLIVRAGAWLDSAASHLPIALYILFASFLVSFFGAVFLAYRTKLKQQHVRDAASLPSGPFVLLLRPFHTDARVGMPHPFADRTIQAAMDGVHPPEYVARVLEPYIDVRQIGGDRERVAASRLFASDDTWQALLAEQTSQAAAVVIMPLVTKTFGERKQRGLSTIWELEHLCTTGALEKTALLLPAWEGIGGIGVPAYVRGRLKKEWRQVQRKAQEFGLDLPDYDGLSDVLVFSQAGGRWTARSVHTGAHPELARNLLDVIDAITLRRGVDLASAQEVQGGRLMTHEEIYNLSERELLAFMAKHGLEATRTPFESTWESGNEVERIRDDLHEADLARWRRALAECLARKG